MPSMHSPVRCTNKPAIEADFHYSDPVIGYDNEVFFTLKNTPFDWNVAAQDYAAITPRGITPREVLRDRC